MLLDIVCIIIRSGNEYILTIMCASTGFPKALPLRNIKTKNIVNALVKFFSFVNLPKYVQSDQGSNVMSHYIPTGYA
jgi:hypothetical protein